MKKDLSELVFILDRSGSMGGLENDTIGGYNSFISKQKEEKGDASLTTVLFDDRYQLLHDGVAIKDVKPLSSKDYFVRGSTALYDALGKTINNIGTKLKNLDENQRPEKVIFVITTDGMENASCEYNQEKVKQMIEHQKEKYNWEFIFLGANIDAVSVAREIGIESEMAVKYCNDAQGINLNYQTIAKAVSSIRKNKKVEKNWKKEIESDYNSRGKN